MCVFRTFVMCTCCLRMQHGAPNNETHSECVQRTFFRFHSEREKCAHARMLCCQVIYTDNNNRLGVLKPSMETLPERKQPSLHSRRPMYAFHHHVRARKHCGERSEEYGLRSFDDFYLELIFIACRARERQRESLRLEKCAF